MKTDKKQTMQYFIFSGFIEHDNPKIEELINLINTTSGHLVIGIDSRGGDVALGQFILEMLNAPNEVNRIKLKALSFIQSGGFTIWCGFKGYKSVLSGSLGLTHSPTCGVNMRGSGRYEGGHATMQLLPSLWELHETTVAPFLTPAERLAFNNDEDVYLPYPRLLDIANAQNLGFEESKK